VQTFGKSKWMSVLPLKADEVEGSRSRHLGAKV
jgi:hypothetical protein